MAQHTIIENIHRNTEDWFAVKAAVRAKGVEIPSGTPTSQYDEKIAAIETYESDFVNLIEGDSTTIDIPSGTTKIAPYKFYNMTSLTSITIPASVEEIGRQAFQNVNIGWRDYYKIIGNCLLEIDNVALTHIIIPTGIRVIASFCFMESNFPTATKLTVPGSVKILPKYAFYPTFGSKNSSITLLNLNEGIETLKEASLSGLTGLTTLILPVSCTNIETHAAMELSNLTDIYYRGTEAQWAEVTIDGDNTAIQNATMHYEYTGDGSEL